MCNTNSRNLLQQSEIFIFLGFLVLGLHPAPNYCTPVECGPTSYYLAYNAGSSLHKSQDSNRVGYKFGPRLLCRLFSHFTFLFGTHFMLIHVVTNTFHFNFTLIIVQNAHVISLNHVTSTTTWMSSR